jgi:hypothetical protein
MWLTALAALAVAAVGCEPGEVYYEDGLGSSDRIVCDQGWALYNAKSWSGRSRTHLSVSASSEGSRSGNAAIRVASVRIANWGEGGRNEVMMFSDVRELVRACRAAGWTG